MNEQERKRVKSNKFFLVLILVCFLALGFTPNIISYFKDQANGGSEKGIEFETSADENEKKIKLEEEKAKLEEDKSKFAIQYCDKRSEDIRLYPLLKIQGENGQRTVPFKDAVTKKGTELSLDNCKEIVAFLFDWDVKDKQSIVDRKYWIGMDQVQLVSSLGMPDDINTTNYGFGKNQQWIYHKDSYGIRAHYIYLDDDQKVTSYQDF